MSRSDDHEEAGPRGGGRRRFPLVRLTQPLGLIATVVGIAGGLAGVLLAIDEIKGEDPRAVRLAATVDCIDIELLTDNENLERTHPGKGFRSTRLDGMGMGIRATFRIHVVGRESQTLPPRRLLIDQHNGRQEVLSARRRTVPENQNDAESEVWWVPLPRGPGRFVYRHELLRPGGVGDALAGADTDPVISTPARPDWRVELRGECALAAGRDPPDARSPT